MNTTTLRAALPLCLLLAGCYVSGDGQLAGGTFGDTPDGLPPEDPFGGGDDGSDDPFDPDSIEVPEAADNVVVLEETECFSTMSLSSDWTITAWFTCDPLTVGIEEGDILVGTMNGGYLRQVDALSVFADHLVATTSQARLEDVLINGGFSESFVFDDGAREQIDFSGTTLWSDGAASISLSQATLNMTPKLDLDADFGWFRLNWARAAMDIEIVGDIELSASLAAGTSASAEIPIGTYSYPFAFMAGPVPVTGKLDLSLAAGVEASASGDITATVGMESTATVHLEGRWDGDWHYTSERDWDATRTGPDIAAQGNMDIKVYIKPEAKVMIYGVAGPGFVVSPFLRGNAQAECWDLDWSFHGGADASVSMNLDLYAWDLSHSFGPWTFESELGAGTVTLPFPLGTNCEDPPDVDPGDDDDAAGDDDDAAGDDDDGGGTEPPPEAVGECTPVATIACGQSVLGDTGTDPGATTAMGAYPVNVGNYDAPELVYTWTASTSSEVEFGFVGARPTQVNHDIVILESDGTSCNSQEAVTWGFNAVTFEPNAGTTYQIVVDGYDGDVGAFELELDCNP